MQWQKLSSFSVRDVPRIQDFDLTDRSHGITKLTRDLVLKFTSRHVYCLGLALLSSSVAVAHPGHGAAQSIENSRTLVHYFTEPFHLSGVVGALVIVVAFAFIVSRASGKNKLARPT